MHRCAHPAFVAAVLVMVPAACAARDGEPSAIELAGNVQGASADVSDAAGTDESVGEAADASLAGTICGTLCSAAAGLSCTALLTTCATASVLSLGTLSVPCDAAMAAACLGSAACILVCAHETNVY